ncbi:MAG: hypothetical protein JW778_01690 [Candidatus Altiarchaeota archaeon]|nr:hypothetical protein [Candidatus Altiarchaeota archaeon]
MKKILTILMILTAIGMATADNGGDPTIFHPHSDIPVDASGWNTSTGTIDCVYGSTTGWAYDRWILTLTEAKDVTIQVDDCCCPGDYFEIYVDIVLIGTTPVPSEWGCESGTYGEGLSSGSATISLTPGTYTIEVRDAGFQAHTAEEIAAENMCPAAFTVSGTTGPYTGTTVPEPALAIGLLSLVVPGMIYLIRKRE